MSVADVELASNQALVIQISTISTKPDLKSKDHARSAVALHLLQVDGQGIPRTTLCTSNPDTIFTYQAVGFKQIMCLVLSIFETSQVTL